MSRVYWHSREATAELHGSERAWLARLARGPAQAAWDLDRFGRAEQLLALVPAADRDYLSPMLEAARTADPSNGKPARDLASATKTHLAVDGLPVVVAGQRLHTANLELNTALAAGSDPVRLAAKIHGWCESHCWIEGPDRKWLADLIQEGLDSGLYRAGIRYQLRPGTELHWEPQGWADVQALLRSRDDGPVVLSYSVCDGFPNQEMASHGGWAAPLNAGEPDDDAWYDLPSDQQWDLALAGLRSTRPWAALSRDTLGEVCFGEPITIYDLFAPDRDERVRRMRPPAVGRHNHGAGAQGCEAGLQNRPDQVRPLAPVPTVEVTVKKIRIARDPQSGQWTATRPAFGFGHPETRTFPSQPEPLSWADGTIGRQGSLSGTAERTAQGRAGKTVVVTESTCDHYYYG